MLAASAHLDKIDAMGGVDDLAAHHQQQAVDVRAATKRAIEVLTAANTDEDVRKHCAPLRTFSGPSCAGARCNDALRLRSSRS